MQRQLDGGSTGEFGFGLLASPSFPGITLQAVAARTFHAGPRARSLASCSPNLSSRSAGNPPASGTGSPVGRPAHRQWLPEALPYRPRGLGLGGERVRSDPAGLGSDQRRLGVLSARRVFEEHFDAQAQSLIHGRIDVPCKRSCTNASNATVGATAISVPLPRFRESVAPDAEAPTNTTWPGARRSATLFATATARPLRRHARSERPCPSA